MDSYDDDPRSTELETLQAIYPEIYHPDPEHPFTFELEVPVVPAKPITVIFPSGLLPATAGNPEHGPNQAAPHEVSHLPSLVLQIVLPEGYPQTLPPEVHISTDPRWVPDGLLEKLEAEAGPLWEEAGRETMTFTYIDHVQRGADEVFGAMTPAGALEMDAQHQIAVLDYDAKARQATFNRETFECGICLDPKKGSKCHKMLDCEHIFCLQCLQDFYGDAIKEGSISTVRCLSPNCAKERSAGSQGNPASRSKKAKTFISPGELLQIGLSEDAVKRYVALKYKTQLETDKDTKYCPRPWCNGAARSEKHKKPEGLEYTEASDIETDTENEEGDSRSVGHSKKMRRGSGVDDRLAICEDCDFAFCRRCQKPWHGEFVYCIQRDEKGEMTAEEKASLEYIALHSSPCPTCNAPAQKTHGCNHMICSRCDTHFCYLCSAWLNPGDPYRHYNEQPGGKRTACYMRLWELEEGDGDDVEDGFAGGLIRRLAQPEPQDVEIPREEDEQLDVPAVAIDARRDDPHGEPQNELPRAARVAQEAPLVLRIIEPQPRRQDPPPDPAQPAPRGRGRGRGRGQAPRARGAGGPANGGHPGARRGAPPQRGRDGGQRGAAVNREANREARRGPVNIPFDLGGDANGRLDAAQEAWVRRFVQMALVDAEDEVDDELGDW